MKIRNLCRVGLCSTPIRDSKDDLDSSEKVSTPDIDNLEAFDKWFDSLPFREEGMHLRGNVATIDFHLITDYSVRIVFNEKTKLIKVSILRKEKVFQEEEFYSSEKADEFITKWQMDLQFDQEDMEYLSQDIAGVISDFDFMDYEDDWSPDGFSITETYSDEPFVIEFTKSDSILKISKGDYKNTWHIQSVDEIASIVEKTFEENNINDFQSDSVKIKNLRKSLSSTSKVEDASEATSFQSIEDFNKWVDKLGETYGPVAHFENFAKINIANVNSDYNVTFSYENGKVLVTFYIDDYQVNEKSSSNKKPLEAFIKKVVDNLVSAEKSAQKTAEQVADLANAKVTHADPDTFEVKGTYQGNDFYVHSVSYSTVASVKVVLGGLSFRREVSSTREIISFVKECLKKV